MGQEAGEARVLQEIGFVHLHVHSSYSLLEGAMTIATLAKMAAADGQPALALTDTDNLFGGLEFSEKLAGSGLQPIVGVQLSIDFADEGEGSRKPMQPQRLPHIVLLAMDEAGYGNLMKLVSEAALATGGLFALSHGSGLQFPGLVVMALILAFSRYGDMKLGAGDDEPEFSNGAWFSMLFAAGMGIGLVYFGVAEPLSHFASPPPGVAARTPEAANAAMRYAFFHWGLHPWAIYGIVGLAIAYFQFRRGAPALVSSATETLPWAWARRLTPAFNVLAVVATAFGVAASLGIRAQTAQEWLKRAYDATGSNLYEAIHNQSGYYGISAPKTLNHRYIFEDVPMSLVPIAAFGQRYGVSVQEIDAIIQGTSSLYARRQQFHKNPN